MSERVTAPEQEGRADLEAAMASYSRALELDETPERRAALERVKRARALELVALGNQQLAGERYREAVRTIEDAAALAPIAEVNSALERARQEKGVGSTHARHVYR